MSFPLSDLELDVRQYQLGNGLRCSIAPIPYLHRATLVVAVRVGSRHENPSNNGISHFLEHMLFRGTAAHPTPYAFNLAVESLGGTLHASTRTDFTTYELTLPPEHLSDGIALMSEIFKEPLLRDLEIERKIVREEILEALDEDGRDVDADNLAHRALFGDHPLAYKIEGNESTLETFSERALRNWHREHYVAANIAIGVAGAIDPVALQRALEAEFDSLPEGERRIPTPFQGPSPNEGFQYVHSMGSQTDIRIILPAPGARDPLHPALDLLGRVLDDGMSTRLYRQLVEDTGLAYEAFGGYDAYDDIGAFSVATSVEHGKTPDMLDAVYSLLDSLRDGTIEAAELEKAKRRALFELRSLLDDAESIAEFIATEQLFGTERSLRQIGLALDATSLEDLQYAAQRTIDRRQTRAVIVGMLSKELESKVRTRCIRYCGL